MQLLKTVATETVKAGFSTEALGNAMNVLNDATACEAKMQSAAYVTIRELSYFAALKLANEMATNEGQGATIKPRSQWAKAWTMFRKTYAFHGYQVIRGDIGEQAAARIKATPVKSRMEAVNAFLKDAAKGEKLTAALEKASRAGGVLEFTYTNMPEVLRELLRRNSDESRRELWQAHIETVFGVTYDAIRARLAKPKMEGEKASKFDNVLKFVSKNTNVDELTALIAKATERLASVKSDMAAIEAAVNGMADDDTETDETGLDEATDEADLDDSADDTGEAMRA